MHALFQVQLVPSKLVTLTQLMYYTSLAAPPLRREEGSGAEEVGHARRCANHAIHGRFNPVNPLSQQIKIYVRAKLYVLTSSGMCVR